MLFNPAIDFIVKRKIPRLAAVVMIYLGFFGMLSLSIYAVVPLFITEIRNFLQVLPQYLEAISPPLQGMGFEIFEQKDAISMLGDSIESMASNVFSAIFVIFGGVSSGLFVITTAFFLSLEKGIFERALALLFPKTYEAYALSLWKRSQKQVSGWFGVRIITCLFVFIACYIAFLAFGVKYPFSLGLLAGLLNFIPYIGPVFTGIILAVLIMPFEPIKGILVLIVFALIQQVEGGILSPLLMKRIMGIPPALIIIALVIGGKLWGVLGAILVIPLTGILFEFLKEFLQKRKEKESLAA